MLDFLGEFFEFVISLRFSYFFIFYLSFCLIILILEVSEFIGKWSMTLNSRFFRNLKETDKIEYIFWRIIEWSCRKKYDFFSLAQLMEVPIVDRIRVPISMSLIDKDNFVPSRIFT